MSKFPAAVPEVPVNDLARALEYYKTNLGFSIDWSVDDIGLAGISRGECRLFLADEGFRSARYRNVGPMMIWLNCDSTDEVDELYRKWQASGATIQAAPELKPHGLHEFTAEDADGNFFRVFHDVGTGG